ncbi:hypothetical protein GOODEAATRI_030977 [Goodea atripinnis]|uniref:Ectonucleoside triphosphate diphosphohydrolase 6 n=1 Tax=Goodea atripinnis TaxID=208336 RepID=A0ABV0N5P0_9TELE
MSARLAILGGVDAPPLGGSIELVSPCLPPEFSGRWEHADVLYTVRGQRAGEPVYQACLNKVQKVLYRKLTKASEAADADFYAFSFYYDRAVDLGVIGKMRRREELSESLTTSKLLKELFPAVCSGLLEPQRPFLCLDLVYISVLLQELGFPHHKQLRLARTINQVETSWALGATFQHLESWRKH